MYLKQLLLQLTLLLGWLFVNAAAQDESSSCSADEIAACALEDRLCVVQEVVSSDGSSTNTASCGPCVEGFFEWERVETGCFNISDLTLQDFIEAFSPVYTDEGDDEAGGDGSSNSTTLLERLQFLKQSAEFIGDYYRSRNASSLPVVTVQGEGGDGGNSTTNSSFEFGLTPFSADGPTEYKQRSGFQANIPLDENAERIPLSPSTTTMSAQDLPDKVDWRARGAVTEVKDQGRCGCCWAISMVGAIEGAAAANNGYLQNLSWQQLISCDASNLGCNGGAIVIALGYSWLNQFGGLTRNNEYPYTDYNGDTTFNCQVDSKPLAVTVSEPRIVFSFEIPVDFDTRVQLMKEALQVAPVSMVIKSACNTLSNYRKGILTDDGDCACSDTSCIDHAILMVGYDDTTNPPSWILKNSWGTSWGEDGYFYISQQAKGDWGLFGVVSQGVQAQLAQNVTAQVADDSVDEPLKPYAWVLIALAAVCVCSCVAGIVRKQLSTKSAEE